MLAVRNTHQHSTRLFMAYLPRSFVSCRRLFGIVKKQLIQVSENQPDLMPHRICYSLFLLGAFCGPALADPFAIDLEARIGPQKAAAVAEVATPGQKAKARPVLHAKAGQRVDVKWVLTNRHPKNSFKDVIVH